MVLALKMFVLGMRSLPRLGKDRDSRIYREGPLFGRRLRALCSTLGRNGVTVRSQEAGGLGAEARTWEEFPRRTQVDVAAQVARTEGVGIRSPKAGKPASGSMPEAENSNQEWEK